MFTLQLGPFELFALGPTLKFSLAWEGKPLYSRPSGFPLRERYLDSMGNVELASTVSNDENEKESKKRLRIFYQFIYNNHTRQQTEARDDCLCPWCSVNCGRLYSLLKHLKCCHGRFLFTYAVSHRRMSGAFHKTIPKYHSTSLNAHYSNHINAHYPPRANFEMVFNV